MFLESPISTSNLPKSWKMYLCRYWQNRLPVFAKLPTVIGEIAYRLAKWPTGIGEIPNCLPVLTNLKMQTYKLCISLLLTFRNLLPVLMKSPIGIGKMAYR